MPYDTALLFGVLIIIALWLALIVWAAEGRRVGAVVWLALAGWMIGDVNGLVTAAGLSAARPGWLAVADQAAVFAALQLAFVAIGVTVGAVVGGRTFFPRRSREGER